ncbi:MAG: hypothetical protein M3082_06230 [Candidatus Dormibacteraeota bacterium]|nr:hypothetical protein [Candidatus Dormibacteraeota bacterium]
MNVALPALVLFLVLLPGFVVRSRFKRAERASLDYSPFGQVVTEAVLWAGVLHAVWLWACDHLVGYVLKPDVLMRLLSADPVGQSLAAGEVAKAWTPISGYFASLFAAAYLLPAAVRYGITALRLDRTGHPLSPLCRFNRAPWYYLLTGADFEKSEAPDLIAVSAVVDAAGAPVLYNGFLDDFYLAEDGTLDRMILQGVTRRPFDADKNANGGTSSADRFYPVDGDYFVLRYSEAITLNVEYIKLSDPRPGQRGDGEKLEG